MNLVWTKFNFHLHGFSLKIKVLCRVGKSCLNSTYMDLVFMYSPKNLEAFLEFKFHLHGFSRNQRLWTRRRWIKFKFHLHGFSQRQYLFRRPFSYEFKFHLHGFSLVKFFILIFQCFLYWFLSISLYFLFFL